MAKKTRANATAWLNRKGGKKVDKPKAKETKKK